MINDSKGGVGFLNLITSLEEGFKTFDIFMSRIRHSCSLNEEAVQSPGSSDSHRNDSYLQMSVLRSRMVMHSMKVMLGSES